MFSFVYACACPKVSIMCTSVSIIMCFYIIMFVCMYMYACVCMYICMMHLCMYVCKYVYLSSCLYVCIYVCMYICMYAYIYSCMYVCVEGCRGLRLTLMKNMTVMIKCSTHLSAVMSVSKTSSRKKPAKCRINLLDGGEGCRGDGVYVILSC